MAMTAAERVRAVRERRRRREIQLTVVLHEDDLREIARHGYDGAASTDRARQGGRSSFGSPTGFGCDRGGTDVHFSCLE